MRQRIFTTAYGERYEAFLSVCLESLRECMPWAEVDVWLGEMDAHSQSVLKHAFPEVAFSTFKPIDLRSDYAALVSSKIEQWSAWFQETADGDQCFLLDADVVVRADLFDHFSDDIDILYTYKPEKWPLNVGVVGAISGERSRNFFSEWNALTKSLLASEADKELAADVAGAVDQYAFLRLCGIAPTDGLAEMHQGPYWVSVQNELVKLEGVHCNVLNQTNSVPYDDSAKVLHYKANMREVIESDGQFSQARSAETSRDMVGVWETTYRRFLDRTLATYVATSRECLDDSHLAAISGAYVESRGMLNSEAAAFASLCRRLGVRSVVECGRARAHSTYLLASLLPDIHIYSIENSVDSDVIFGNSRMAGFNNVSLLQGDAHKMVDAVLSNADGPVALLIDGPKGVEAVCLAQKTCAKHRSVVLVGIHDMHQYDTTSRGLPNISRHWFCHAFDRFCFTDHDVITEAFADLDAGSGLTPYRKGPWDIGSYGPTLGIALITWRDRFRARRQLQSRLRRVRLQLLLRSKGSAIRGCVLNSLRKSLHTGRHFHGKQVPIF